MTWAVGVLTWNDHATCRQTLAGLSGLSGFSHLVVYDNGSDHPFTHDAATVVRGKKNLGAGGGMTALVKYLLTLPIEALVFLEDDWMLERLFHLSALDDLVSDPEVGQVRLGVRPETPPESYYTYGLKGANAENAKAQAQTPHRPYAFGRYQRIRSLWSNNPFACRREVAERFLLTGWDEKRMARPYYESGMTTISTTPGHFRHLGSIRDRRKKSGWTK